jgi:uncharacterized protein
MADPFPIAKTANGQLVELLPSRANRHGLITGATGSGKTVSLQLLADNFSRLGVPVFLADVKGDLSGVGAAGSSTPKLRERLTTIGADEPVWAANPVVFWDVFGRRGIPLRATVSDIGPLLLGRLLNLNATQQGVLTLVFKIADDAGLLLLDLKDLRAMLQTVGERAREFTTEYGNISAASVGAIQRGLVEIEEQGGDRFFGEPMLDVDDLLQTDRGRGVVNVLAAEELIRAPKVYATFLLWMVSELFERLPEVGDVDKPVLVFFFDEAHLLFDDAPPALVEKIEQVVRLIRSKGVGVYFITQSPSDVPEKVIAQLGNRVQHTLRAFTPRDQKAVRAAAETLRPNPAFDTRKALVELGIGEALVSMLDAAGSPTVTERAWVLPPASRIGPLNDAERDAIRSSSSASYGHYEKVVDRESAYERLKAHTGARSADAAGGASADAGEPGRAPGRKPLETQEPDPSSGLTEILFGRTGPRGGQYDGLVQSAAKSAARSLGSGFGRAILRGALGSILGGKR